MKLAGDASGAGGADRCAGGTSGAGVADICAGGTSGAGVADHYVEIHRCSHIVSKVVVRVGLVKLAGDASGADRCAGGTSGAGVADHYVGGASHDRDGRANAVTLAALRLSRQLS